MTLIPPQASPCEIFGLGDTVTGFSPSTAVSAVCECVVKEHAEKERLGHQYRT